MAALEELFDAQWLARPEGYRLALRPEAASRQSAAARKALESALERTRAKPAEELPPAPPLGRFRSYERPDDTLGRLIFACLTLPQQKSVLAGARVSIAVPEERAAPIYALMLQQAERLDAPRVGPILATADLDMDPATSLPVLRARATAVRASSALGAISIVDIHPQPPAPAHALKPLESVKLPDRVGRNGRLNDTLDMQIVQLGAASGVPILSRQRVSTGLPDSVAAAGRTVSAVAAEIASAAGARGEVTSRGYLLLRSQTEAIDSLGRPEEAIVTAYLKARPEHDQPVQPETLAILARLTPLQLAVLQSMNLCSNEADTAYRIQAVLRFYTGITPSQRAALDGPEGLFFGELDHPALHLLVDARVKRADWDIHPHMHQLEGLAMRFIRARGPDAPLLTLEAARGAKIVNSVIVELPIVQSEASIKPVP